MNTQQYNIRILLYFCLLSILITSCSTPDRGAQATTTALYDTARIALDGRITKQPGQSYDSLTPEAIAISAVLTAQRGAFALVNDAEHLAVFLTPAGKNGTGATYYLYAIVNTSRTCLVNANWVLDELGIDRLNMRTLDDLTRELRYRGFVELTPAVAPTLLATLRLGIGFLRSLGTSISDIIVIPALMLTPEQLSPWCGHELNCEMGIQQ